MENSTSSENIHNFCTNCGSLIQPGSSFCTNCGQRISSVETGTGEPMNAVTNEEGLSNNTEEKEDGITNARGEATVMTEKDSDMTGEGTGTDTLMEETTQSAESVTYSGVDNTTDTATYQSYIQNNDATNDQYAGYANPGYNQNPGFDQNAAYTIPGYNQNPGFDQYAGYTNPGYNQNPAYNQNPGFDPNAGYNNQAYNQNVGYSNQGYYQNGQQPYPANAMKAPKEPRTPQQKKKLAILISAISAGAVAVIGLAIFLFIYFSYTRFDMSQLVKYQYDGFNKEATVQVQLDLEKEELAEYLAEHYADNVMDSLLSGDISLPLLLDSIDFELSKNSNLANGDEIEVKAIYDVDAFKDKKIKFTNTEFSFTVEGLKDGVGYDLFKDLGIEFTGTSGYGSLTLNHDNLDEFCKNNVYYSYDNGSNLKNGDTVTIYADVSEELLKSNNYKVTAMQKQITVSGLAEAVEYDVFKDIVLVYDGISPELYVSINTDACEQFVKDYVYFSVNPNYSLKNGDQLTIEAQIDDEVALSQGYIISNKVKTVTVEQQSEYLSAVDETTRTMLDELINQTIEQEKENGTVDIMFGMNISDLAGTLVEGHELELKQVASYFGTGSSAQYNNYVNVYQCNVSAIKIEEEVGVNLTFYISVMLNEIYKDAAGKIVAQGSSYIRSSETVEDILYNIQNAGYTITEIMPLGGTPNGGSIEETGLVFDRTYELVSVKTKDGIEITGEELSKTYDNISMEFKSDGVVIFTVRNEQETGSWEYTNGILYVTDASGNRQETTVSGNNIIFNVEGILMNFIMK